MCLKGSSEAPVLSSCSESCKRDGMAAKTVLIVYAHQSAGSFNAAAKDATVDVLKKQGCKVLVSDLYAMTFKATATEKDITGSVKNPEHFCYGEETMLAWKEGRLASDIVEEHKKLQEAELVVFQVDLLLLVIVVCCLQFPMYWFSVPAIMKGWLDRVLTLGFAYTSEKRYSQGIFRDKKAMLSFTTGSHESMFSSNGINGDMNVTLWPIQNGVLYYCGFQVLAPQIFWAPMHLSPEGRENLLESWRTRLQGLLSETPLAFPPADSFDAGNGFQLKPDIKKQQAESPFGLTVGHHMEKPLPPHNQMKAGV
ncbi:NAD(P)H dehydrogenase [quinone] 1-like [Myxocyprinus asiaticus]|uniref:NAD(P)H dehydrogenase [quinone] 1-like n=1 Tax=Myxocyprinus asiaticus TaxID=70543 RepID=UPI002222F983|nr:NAD(P)H dehydrogenase [quinone] 1-like [Myxocyprinus asiaticus]